MGATGKLTVLSGYVRAVTDQCDSSNIAAGDYLSLGTDGKLQKSGTSGGADMQLQPVAVATKVGLTETILGTAYAGCIEYITL